MCPCLEKGIQLQKIVVLREKFFQQKWFCKNDVFSLLKLASTSSTNDELGTLQSLTTS